MTEPTTTAVATRRTALPPEAQRIIDERRAINVMATEMANLSWGKSLDLNARRAIAEYCRRYNIDGATEIDILGGKLYRNAAYFIRRGAELRKSGLIREVRVDHVNADERLTKLATGADVVAQQAGGEVRRREWMRASLNIPESAKGACIVTIIPVDGRGGPIVGWNIAGSVGKKNDPIGDDQPGKTAETRAYRRAWRHLVDTVPGLSEIEGQIEDDGRDISEIVTESRSALRAQTEEHHRVLPPAGRALGAITQDYDLPTERVRVRVPEVALPDEYEGPPPTAAAHVEPAEPIEESDEEIRSAELEMVAQEEAQQQGLGLADDPAPRRRRDAVREGR